MINHLLNWNLPPSLVSSTQILAEFGNSLEINALFVVHLTIGSLSLLCSSRETNTYVSTLNCIFPVEILRSSVAVLSKRNIMMNTLNNFSFFKWKNWVPLAPVKFSFPEFHPHKISTLTCLTVCASHTTLLGLNISTDLHSEFRKYLF